MGSIQQTYDVFLSYNSRDRQVAVRVAEALRHRGLRVFYDQWYLTPGLPWPQELERVLEECRAVAIFVGSGGLGRWQRPESDLALDRQKREMSHGVTFPVIPVILPGADPPLGFLGLNTWVPLHRGAEDEAGLRALINAVRGLPPGEAPILRPASTICPYRGLRFFREEDEPFFFGREEFSARLLRDFQQKSFVAVVGESGSGKSSVVRAGLLPKLRAGVDGKVWDVLTFTPGSSTLDSNPLHALASAMIPILEPGLNEVDRLVECRKLFDHLAAGTLPLQDVAQRCLEKQRGTDQLLLFVDQWEELYSLCKDEGARNGFINEMLSLNAHEAVRVVLTLRGDFYGRALTHRGLVDRFQGAVVNLGPMTRDELRRALVEPARKADLEFERGLVERILDEVGDQPGNLPLLEYVLQRLWERQERGMLRFEAYEEMKGLKGAIATRADEIFQSRLTPRQQEVVRRVLLQMVRPGEGPLDTRKRAVLSNTDEDALTAVRKLADERLLVTGRDETREDVLTVEIAHEALIQNWGLLRKWIDEDREFLRTRERIETAAAMWEKEGCLDDRLLSPGRPLAEAEELLRLRRADLGVLLTRFIEASLEAEKRRVDAANVARLQKQKRINQIAIAALLLAAFMTALSIFAIRQRNAATEATRLARSLQEAAEREKDMALGRARAARSLLLAERGEGTEAMVRAAVLAVDSWKRVKTSDAHLAATKLLNLVPFGRFLERDFSLPPAVGVVLSPDGRFLVECSPMPRILETESGKEVGRFKTDGTLIHAQFSSNGRFLLIGDMMGDTLRERLISTDDAQVISTVSTESFEQHLSLEPTGLSLAVATMSPDGRWLAMTGQDGITILNTSTGTETLRVEHRKRDSDRRLGLFFSPDNGILVIREAGAFRLIEVPSGRERARFTVAGTAVGRWFVGSGQYLAIETAERGRHEREIRLFDSSTGNELCSVGLGEESWVQFSEDERLLLVGDDRNVRLFELPLGKERASWKVRASWGGFSGNSQWLVLAAEAGVLRLIDAASGQEKHKIEPHCQVSGVRFTPDAHLFVVACKDGQVRSLDTRDGVETARFKVGGGLQLISPDASFVVSQEEDGTILRVNDTRTGRELGTTVTDGPVSPPAQGATPMARSASVKDARYLAVLGSSGRIQLLDFKRFFEPTIVEFDRKGPIVLNGDRRLLAFANRSQGVRVVETATGRNVCTFAYAGPAFPVMFSPDGRTLMMRQGRVLRLNEIDTRREVARLQLDRPIHGIVDISPDGKHLVVSEEGPKFVNEGMIARLIETGSLKEILRFPYAAVHRTILNVHEAVAPQVPAGHKVPDIGQGSPVSDVSFSPDGGTAAMTCPEDGVVRFIDTAGGAERMRIAPGGKPWYADFSPDGRTLALEVFDNSVRLIDAASGKEWARLQHQRSKKYLATARPQFSPDGRTLAVSEIEDSGGMVNAWLFEVDTGRELCHVYSGWGHDSHDEEEPLVKHGIAFSRDGRYFSVGSVGTDPVRLFETATGKELAAMHLGKGFAGVAFSPDARYLAAASHDGFTRLLEIENRKQTDTSRYAKPVTHLAFSPDSRFMITGSEDGTARMTETASGMEIARFEHGEPITSTAFFQEGKGLATLGADKIKIWPADPNSPFERLCRMTRCNPGREEWTDLFGESEPWAPVNPGGAVP